MRRRSINWILTITILSMIAALTTGCEEEEDPLITYTLSLAVNPEGSGEVIGAGDYEEGETVSLNATSNEGYEFINWTGANAEEVSGSANFSFTMPAENVTLTANFEEESPFSVDEYEPNDSRAEAAQIDLGTDIEATLFPEGDVDYFEFTTANTDDEWDLIEYSVTQVSEDVRIDLTVYDKNGEEVFNDRAANEGAKLITTMATQGGTYFVKIDHHYASPIGRYTLNVKNLNANDQYAPNHTRETAYDLGTLPSTNMEGVLVSTEEVDWFKFTTENHGDWDIVAFTLSDVSADLRVSMTVYDLEGNSIFTERTSNEGAGMTRHLATDGGTFFVSITNYYSDPGEYTIDIENLDANDQYAPNHTMEDAHDLGMIPVSDVNGALLSGYEEDWFSFTAESKDEYNIQFNVTDVSVDLRIQMKVYDEQGNAIFTETAANDGASLFANMSTTGGTYYVRFTIYYSDPGEYTLEIIVN